LKANVMRLNRLLSQVLAMLVALASVILVSLPAAALEKVVLGLDWQALGRHAGFFTAKAKGFYEREGLDVDIQRGYGAADSVKRVAAGDSAFAFGDYGSLILARSEGIKVKAIAMIYARGPYVLWTRKDANIASPKDLPGKSVGSPAGASVRLLFPAFASAAGFDANSVKWVTVDAAGLYPLLFSGQAQAIVDYELGWPTISKRAAEAGIALAPLKFADYGFDIYSNAILATDDTLKNKPDLARKFVKASLEGMQAAFADPAAAGEIMKRAFPILDAGTAAQEVSIVRTLAESGDAKQHGLGYISPGKAELTKKIIVKTYDIKTDVPVEDTFSNDFLPEH
jgi:NitT/TauT family transport system substrate-binding protein